MKRRAVAQAETVETLAMKVRIRARENPAWYRLVRATDRAMHSFDRAPTGDVRGFYHGLLTGYAVAVKALQGKVTSAPPR